MTLPGFSRDSKQSAKKNIFINYRVHDTAGETGRLVDSLKQYFSEDQIFMDIDKIEPGVDFTKAISKSLQSCDVMLAIIGPNWLGLDSSKNTSRIKDPNDWVKTEISTALQRDIRVVPVLVDGGQLPQADEIPPELQPLLTRQTYEISNKRWKYDTDQLISFLIKLGITPKISERQNIAVPKQKTWWTRNSWWVYILVGIFITIGIIQNNQNEKKQDNTNPVDNANTQETSPVNKPEQNDVMDNSSSVNVNAGNIAGTWVESDEGEVSTFVITQNGSGLNTQVYAMNQLISSGTGYINGNNVELHITLFGINTLIKGKLSADERRITGTYTYETTGAVQPFTLLKQ